MILFHMTLWYDMKDVRYLVRTTWPIKRHIGDWQQRRFPAEKAEPCPGWCWWALQHRDRGECSQGCGQDKICSCSSETMGMQLWRLWSDCNALWLWQSAVHVELQVSRVTSSKIWPVFRNTELPFSLYGGCQKLFSASVDHVFDWSFNSWMKLWLLTPVSDDQQDPFF